MTADTISDFEKVEQACRRLSAATCPASNLIGIFQHWKREVFKLLHLMNCAVYLVVTDQIYATRG